MHARRPPLGQRRQARAAPQTERGEGGEVPQPEGERASVAQREGEGGAIVMVAMVMPMIGVCLCSHACTILCAVYVLCTIVYI